MAKNDVEVEIKIPVNKKLFEKVRKNLKRNAKLVDASREVDKYFNSPHRNFLAKTHPSEYLRVRIKGCGGSITYKNVYFNRKGERTHSDEFESNIDGISQVIKILEALGFDNFITIDKQRETYIYKTKFKIALDKVKGLGHFVEVEALKDFGGIKLTRGELYSFAKELGVDPNKQDKNGYVLLMMKKKKLLKKLV